MNTHTAGLDMWGKFNRVIHHWPSCHRFLAVNANYWWACG